MIWDATNRFGAVLENVAFDPVTRVPDYDDGSKTENTRSAYPLEFIPNASRSGRAGHPKNIIFLTADAYRRDAADCQADADTSDVSFSFRLHRESCRHRERSRRRAAGILDLLRRAVPAAASVGLCRPAARLHQQAQCRRLASQLRMDRRQIRRRSAHADQGDAYVVDAALDGSLKNSDFRTDPYFGFSVPTSVPGVEPHLLNPFKTWKDKAEFDKTARELVGMFQKNFAKFEKHVTPDIKAAAPEVRIAAE